MRRTQRGAVLLWRFEALKLSVRVLLSALPEAQGVAAEWSAQSSDPDGLYVGAHDGQGYTKTLLWDSRAVTFTFHQPDPQKSRQELTLPYPVVFAAFEGD